MAEHFGKLRKMEQNGPELDVFFFLSVPAGIKSFLLDMCTHFKKAALQLLWDSTPDTLKMAYIWLLTTWYGTAKMASYKSQVLLLLLFCPPILFWRHTRTMLPLLAGSNTTIPTHSSFALDSTMAINKLLCI